MQPTFELKLLNELLISSYTPPNLILYIVISLKEDKWSWLHDLTSEFFATLTYKTLFPRSQKVDFLKKTSIGYCPFNRYWALVFVFVLAIFFLVNLSNSRINLLKYTLFLRIRLKLKKINNYTTTLIISELQLMLTT